MAGKQHRRRYGCFDRLTYPIPGSGDDSNLRNDGEQRETRVFLIGARESISPTTCRLLPTPPIARGGLYEIRHIGTAAEWEEASQLASSVVLAHWHPGQLPHASIEQAIGSSAAAPRDPEKTGGNRCPATQPIDGVPQAEMVAESDDDGLPALVPMSDADERRCIFWANKLMVNYFADWEEYE